MANLDIQTPTYTSSRIMQVTDAQLHQFADLLYGRTGIRISPHKKLLLSNRLRRRLKETGIKDFGEYYKHLRQISDNDPEWDAMLQEITTHETYLFRDDAQWDWFRTKYLAERADAARRGTGQKSLRIWSAACSTGDEPVSMACCIAACIPEFQKWTIQILGTDIGVGALKQAGEATFDQRAMRLVPDDFRRRFFTKEKDREAWRALPVVKDLINYRQHNLMEPIRERAFDFVTLKNVLIYFDPLSKTTVLHNVRAVMKPGALLMVSAAEGVSDLLRDFRRLEPWLYQKPT